MEDKLCISIIPDVLKDDKTVQKDLVYSIEEDPIEIEFRFVETITRMFSGEITNLETIFEMTQIHQRHRSKFN